MLLPQRLSELLKLDESIVVHVQSHEQLLLYVALGNHTVHVVLELLH